MHSYSIDTKHRLTIAFVIAAIAFSATGALNSALKSLPLPPWASFSLSSGTLFTALYYWFDVYLWRLVRWAHGVPYLGGQWDGSGVSSFVDPETQKPKEYKITLTIKQTFSRIEVYAETGESSSRSFMASIETEHVGPLFRYAYDNRPKNMANPELQRHPGMMDLNIKSNDLMEGDYFSGKHRLRFGEAKFRRVKK